MIIDIRSHFKKIQESTISRSEIEDQLRKAMSYLDFESSLRKLSIHRKLSVQKEK